MIIYHTQVLRELSKSTLYINRYIKLITHFKSLNKIEESLYCETHHILPKCLGGSNEKDNLVILPYRVHFIAHLLLAKATQNHKLIAAFNGMCTRNNTKYKPTSIIYALAKRLFSDSNRGEFNPSYKMVSAWNKEKKERCRVSIEEFRNNRHIYSGITSQEAILWKIENEGYVRKQQSEYQKLRASESSKNNSPAKLSSTGELIGRISKLDPRWNTGEIVGATAFINRLIL